MNGKSLPLGQVPRGTEISLLRSKGDCGSCFGCNRFSTGEETQKLAFTDLSLSRHPDPELKYNTFAISHSFQVTLVYDICQCHFKILPLRKSKNKLALTTPQYIGARSPACKQVKHGKLE
jgi:hypothetical protein